jgi:hypothetical protein
VETGCSPYSFIICERKGSDATNIFRSFDISNEMISLSIGSITTHQSHINSEEPTFIAVLSIMYP